MTNSTIESSQVALTSKHLSLGSSDNYTTATFVSTPPASNIPIVESNISFAMDDFQNLKLQNSKISNSNAVAGGSCHNFDLEASLIMEANHEDIDVNKKYLLTWWIFPNSSLLYLSRSLIRLRLFKTK
jgi:hypothetical protein